MNEIYSASALRQEMVRTCLYAFRQGLFTGTNGNLSCYLRDEAVMLITPSGVRYDQLQPEQIVRLTLDGAVLDGTDRPSSEWRMHAAVYQAFPSLGAILHTHSPYATAFAVVRKTIPAVLIEAPLFLGGDIRCAPYATPGTRQVGENAVPALEDRGGCTLANHGVLAVGEDLTQACLRAEYIEDLAREAYLAAQLGTPTVLEHL